ncbi:zf-HC2 domain-containing protein [bacterium]|nr:zf-HC2 domain-containing protein [bacterium]
MDKTDRKLGQYISRAIDSPETGGECLPEDMLAGLMDDILTGVERSAVIKHLAGCQKCRQVLAEAMEIQDVLSTEGEMTLDSGNIHANARQPAAPVRPEFPNDQTVISAAGKVIKRRSARITVILPALAAAVFLVVWIMKPYSPGSFKQTMAALLHDNRPVELNKALAIDLQKAFIYSFYSGVSIDRAAFRVGVLLIGLEISLRSGDHSKVMLQLRPLVSLLKSIDSQAPVVRQIEKWHVQIESGVYPASIVDSVPQLEELLKDKKVNEFMLFGSWVQAGKLAAGARQHDFILEKTVDFYIQYARRQDLPPGVERSLLNIRRLLQEGQWDEIQFDAVELAFAEILKILM